MTIPTFNTRSINIFFDFQETETAGLTLTDRKMEQLSTREGVQRSFEQETKKQRNNQQEIATNYDQGEIYD